MGVWVGNIGGTAMAINIGTKMVIQDDTVRRARESVQQTPDQRTAAGRADAVQNARPGNVTPEEKEDRVKAAQEEQRKASESNTLNEAKGKIISESRDGDTVRASERSIEALSDGMVLPKGPDNAEAQPAKEEQEKENNVQSLNGYSESQLEALYREGKISMQERDKEIKKREELKEAAGMSVNNADAAKEAEEKKEAQETRDSAVGSVAKEDEDKTETYDAQKENELTEARTRNIEEENEAFNNFERTMNNVISVQARLNQDPDLERFGTVEGFNIVTK